MATIEAANFTEPTPALGYVVYTKKDWADNWAVDGELQAINAERLFGAGGVEKAELRREYGSQIRDPGGRVSNRNRRNLSRHWVKIALLVPDGNQRSNPETIFVGRIETRPEDIHGSEVGSRRNGVQTFVALGPAHILRNTHISHSVWQKLVEVEPGEFEMERQVLGRTFSFNSRESDGDITGNRGSTQMWDSYTFGGEGPRRIPGGADQWDHTQIVEYFIEQFLNQKDEQGQPKRRSTALEAPLWTLGGTAIDYLTLNAAPIDMPAITSAADMLAKIIDRARGLDFFIVPTTITSTIDDPANPGNPIDVTDEVFEIRVVATRAESIEFVLLRPGNKGVTFAYPKNPATITIDVANRKYMTATVEPSTEQIFDGVRVVSDPIITIANIEAGLHGGWTPAVEQDYAAGDPNGPTPRDHDSARGADRFRDVWQLFVNQTFDWAGKIPNIKLDGSEFNPDGKFQRRHRRTLNSLHLLEGVDYSEQEIGDPPPPIYELGATTPDRRPLMVLAKHQERFTPIDMMSVFEDCVRGAQVSAPENDWGVRLRSHPNHVLAKTNWNAASPSNFDPDLCGLEWQTLRPTIAIHTDHRIELGQDLPEAQQSGLGLIKIIRVPAKFVYLPGSTIVDADARGRLKRSPTQGYFAFEDFHKLAAKVPGAISRFLRRRASATITVKRLQTWDTSLGRILNAVQSGRSRQNITTPITSVRWDFKTFTTTVRAGHANR